MACQSVVMSERTAPHGLTRVTQILVLGHFPLIDIIRIPWVLPDFSDDLNATTGQDLQALSSHCSSEDADSQFLV